MTSGDGYAKLSGGEKFAVTARVVPPAYSEWDSFEKQLAQIKGARWVFVADDTGGAPHVSPTLAAVKMKQSGLEPVPEIGLRDRNRIALRGDAMGLALAGVKAVWCSTGVHQALGAAAGARNVYDLDLPQLVAMLKGRDGAGGAPGVSEEEGAGGTAQSGEAAAGAGAAGGSQGNGTGVDLVVGAQINPSGGPIGLRMVQLAKLVHAGTDFFVTSPIADVTDFTEWLDAAAAEGLLNEPAVLVSLAAPDTGEDFERLERTLPGVAFGEEWAEAARKGPDGVFALVDPLAKKVKGLKGVAGISVWVGSTGEAAGKVIEALVR
ncbi:hypothetical protein AMJ71_09175 [candidate division TA06 bacterium SM1_40]|uniref:Methylenetetrahydrofolate reductase n=2 Tax=Bacteria division TA06 TaxID=1156500 RepID=A0A0S8JEQ1_UNCT6|nr:MAG: hypothetical protein AMJ71_09175 [candidate division TA06 bacterium SM1_40]